MEISKRGRERERERKKEREREREREIYDFISDLYINFAADGLNVFIVYIRTYTNGLSTSSDNLRGSHIICKHS